MDATWFPGTDRDRRERNVAAGDTIETPQTGDEVTTSDAEGELPSIARMYDYYLGGSDHRPVDRTAARRALAIRPEITEIARANRAFLGRVVRFLATAGIRQFLDIGAGLPTRDNVHQVAQRVTAGTKVLYVDNDPAAISHGQALLHGSDTAWIIDGDVLDPAAVLAHTERQRLIDLDRPVAILILAVLHFIPDDDAIRDALAHLRRHVAPGSYLALSCGVSDGLGADAQSLVSVYRGAGSTTRCRTDIVRFFTGFDVLDPGVVPLPLWWPDHSASADRPEHRWIVGGVGRKR
jgi:hypothetical protein